ncbi:glycerol-3-phosphate dehydrogenase [Lysinibacillus composti]|uniref:Glycerol-3-phosphate dehydrogenase n=1 Tax=Lysinibacillus composti TaxID=720633 RepID=A0A3N9UDK0_9BACI|nr:glycerol-3-phosphate dehydrogenase/oxidase [Lysinibacillus composti]MBM7608849.1 glycerol-3-phosphate dehydrogenase [Lysinibacillus composti]RQW74429.1 glycerol-3-phosphate dehydrogenase/oxidase [Lysinibacillus composti]
MFSFKERTNIINILNRYSFDVLVIGGGITGAGIALDAASRGLSVALVEMQDFAAGTSSRSTKLVHGGLRYLKQFEVGLVAEVGREREIVYENAVHVTTPEWMLLPLYKEGTLGKLSTSVALNLYDKLAKVKKTERRQMLSKKETLEKIPNLKQEGLLGAGYYVEYKTDDARLTIEVLKKAVEYKAICLNYARVTDFITEKKKIVAANVRDEISGETMTIHAKQIVNATGPWVDEVRKLDQIENGKYLKLTKGIHIVLNQSDFPLEQAVYFDTPDGRMVFAIPRDGKTYVGTTDTFYEEDPVQPIATKEEVVYLLDAIHHIFPDLNLRPEQVESTWAGIRPLIAEAGKDPSEISRKDEIWFSSNGLMTIAGGKLTGYRQMAEEIVDKIVKRHRFKHAQDCETKYLLLSGAKGLNSQNFNDYVANKAKVGEAAGIEYEEAKRLVRRYGTNVDRVFEYARTLELNGLPKALHAELLYAIYHEMIYTPSDFFIRRTGQLYFNIEQVERFKEAVLDIMQEIIGYSDSEKLFYQIQLDQFLEDAKNPAK